MMEENKKEVRINKDTQMIMFTPNIVVSDLCSSFLYFHISVVLRRTNGPFNDQVPIILIIKQLTIRKETKPTEEEAIIISVKEIDELIPVERRFHKRVINLFRRRP